LTPAETATLLPEIDISNITSEVAEKLNQITIGIPRGVGNVIGYFFIYLYKLYF
jgi:hypothetical protein